MAIIGLQKGSGKKVESQGKVSEKSRFLIWIMSGNPAMPMFVAYTKTRFSHAVTQIM